MRFLRFGYVTGPLIGAFWTFIIATTVAVTMSFVTGDAFRPSITQSVIFGAPLGLLALYRTLVVPERPVTETEIP